MDLFTQIKMGVSVKEAAEYYGLEVNRGNMVCCPFHADRTPSMKLNEDYFYCFGCGAHGDVIDLVAKLFNLSSYDAAKKLAYDFGIDPDKPPAAAALRKPKYPLAKAFQKEELHCRRILCDYLHLLEHWKVQYAPKTPEEFGAPIGTQQSGSDGERTSSGMSELPPQGGNEGYEACEDEDDRFVEACQMLDYIEDGVHETIVSKETFAKAEERLKRNVAHRKTRSDSTTVYPLTGLIRCPDCGKNIFGYTAPPRKKKNGKEGYYPRYISYRCISGRDRNGISCSLANKYYSGTKLETEVKEVISSMVTIPEFVELISQKIDIQTDVNSLRKKQTAIQNEITKYNGNLLQTEKRLTELDIADRHYQNKVDSLNRILDDLYEKIEDAQTRLDEVNQEITMVEKSAMTKKSIFEMLEGFSKYYDVMSPEDKKALLQAMVSFIELYPEKRDDKHLIKTIHFTFPVTYDGESGALFVRTNEQQVETVVLLSK